MGTLNNLAITSTNSIMTSAIGKMYDTLQSKIGNGGRDSNCKFYYNAGAGGSVLQVATRAVVGGVVAPLKNIADNHFNSALNGKKKKTQQSKAWIEAELSKQEKESKLYGQMVVDEGTIYALDDWGCKCPDALMLGIMLDEPINVTQEFPAFGNSMSVVGMNYTPNRPGVITNKLSTKTLVWYDTTAIVNISSDKNLISTKVQGRDYSRKELVSNGDIKFTVSGQITSGKPDLYPTEEIQKFIKVMRYKGIVRVNNQILDQFGISHIVIENFSITPQEGYKSMQKYTFSAIGLQPEKEIIIKTDTVQIEPPKDVDTAQDSNEWLDMIKSQLNGLKSMATDLFSQGTGLASGMLDGLL